MQFQDTTVALAICGPTEVKELLQAERRVQTPGVSLALSVGGRVLADDALLHPDHPNRPYELHVWNKKQAKPVSNHAVAVSLCTGHDCRQCEVACGSFAFELPAIGGLERKLCCALSGQPVPLDLRIRVPIALDTRPWTWVEHPDAAGSDVVVWQKLLEISADASDHHVELIQPKVARNLLELAVAGGLSGKASFVPFDPARPKLCVLCDDGHWACLWMQPCELESATVAYFDGIPGRLTRSASILAEAVASFSGWSLEPLQALSCVLQEDSDLCASIALTHAALILPGWSFVPAGFHLRIQDELLATPPHFAQLVGAGGVSDLQQGALSKLLEDKGVPSQLVAEKAWPGPHLSGTGGQTSLAGAQSGSVQAVHHVPMDSTH